MLKSVSYTPSGVKGMF